MNDVTRTGQWKEHVERLKQMKENLTATREALKAKTPKTRRYLEARSEMCVQLLREAGTVIKNAEGILEQNPELEGGYSYTAFEMCLLVAFRNMQLALRDAGVVKGTRDWKETVKGGNKTAEIRYGGDARNAVNGMIDNLKRPIYEDFSQRELWSKLFGEMDAARIGEDGDRLDPIEKWIKGNADKSTISYSGDRGKPLTYKTFKNRLSS